MPLCTARFRSLLPAGMLPGVPALVLTHVLALVLPLPAFAADAFSDAFIAEELQRARQDPDHRVIIEVDAPIEVVFDALLSRLNEYSEDIERISFRRVGSAATEPALGSERVTLLTNGDTLVQRLVELEPPYEFAYFTDVEKSGGNLPIDYSIGQYELTELEDGRVRAQISVVFEPSSRWLSFFVRRGFVRLMNRDFARAEAYLNRSGDGG